MSSTPTSELATPTQASPRLTLFCMWSDCADSCTAAQRSFSGAPDRVAGRPRYCNLLARQLVGRGGVQFLRLRGRGGPIDLHRAGVEAAQPIRLGAIERLVATDLSGA